MISPRYIEMWMRQMFGHDSLKFGQCGLKKLYMFHSKWLFLYHCSQGADYIYETYVEPFFCKHSESLDRNWVHLRNKLVATSKSLCNKALLAMQLKLIEVIHEKISTSHPVVSIIFSFKPFIMFKLGNLDFLLVSVSLWRAFNYCELWRACIFLI